MEARESLRSLFYSTLSKMLMTQSGDNRSGEKERDVGYKWNLLMN